MKSKRNIFLSSVIGLGLFVAALRFIRRCLPTDPISKPNPARTYSEALERIDVVKRREDAQARIERGKEAVNTACTTGLYAHGNTVDRAIVFIHGFTNCPAQFDALAKRCHDQGYNVLVPRLPRHGYANRMTDALSLMTAEDLVQAGEEAVDIARGLGRHVTVVGFSLGGIVASWLAQQRADIDRAVIISAAFNVQALPPWLNLVFARLLPLFPDSFFWWDPKAKESYIGARYAYQRFSMHSFAQMLRLGVMVQNHARRRAPATQEILVSINPTDQTVNNFGSHRLITHWRSHGTNVAVHQFDDALELLHDFVDPTQPYARVEEVYPVLVELIEDG